MERWRGFDEASDPDEGPPPADDAQSFEDDAVDDEDDEMSEGVWELDPNDPTHPDYDLSVDAGPAGWDATPSPPLIGRGLVVAITVLVIIGLTVPFWFRLFY